MALIDNKTQLKYGPANMALKNYYAAEYNVEKLKEIKEYCLNYLVNEKNIKKIFFKIIKTEVNRTMVDIAFKTLPAEYRQYAEYRYRYNKKLVYISIKLNVATSQLGKWDMAILKKIKNYMQFHITPIDAYNQDVIINLIEVLSQLIHVFKTYDAECEIVSPYYLKTLLYRREQLAGLLFVLNDYVKYKHIDVHHQLIYEQIQHPMESQTQLAARCHCDKSVISRNLSKFYQRINEYMP